MQTARTTQKMLGGGSGGRYTNHHRRLGQVRASQNDLSNDRYGKTEGISFRGAFLKDRASQPAKSQTDGAWVLVTFRPH